MKSKNLVYFLAAIFAMAACSKGNSPKPTPQSTKTVMDTAQSAVWPTDADVYFAGTQTGAYPNNQAVATVWKNGVAMTLNSSQSEANAIAVNGSDVYVAGALNNMAVYWKNGVFSNLGKSNQQSRAYAVTAIGNDVFVAGNVEERAAYWKNNILTVIARQDSNTIYQANAIAVNGSDVYLAGYSLTTYNAFLQAVVWKNGIPTILSGSTGLTNSMVNAIAINGSDIYLVGYTSKGAALWENGVLTTLPGPASTANAIVINGSDVYVAGYINTQPAVWKNGIATVLPYDERGTPGSYIGIGMNGNDVYVAGGFDNAINSIYWKNNAAYQFSKNQCIIYGIAIAKH